MLFDSKSSLYLFYSWFVNSRTLRISFHSFIENELFYIKMVNYSNLVYKSTKYLVYNRYSNILNHSFSAQNFLAFLSILSHITTFLLCYWCLGTCPCFVLDSGSWTHVFSCVYVCVCVWILKCTEHMYSWHRSNKCVFIKKVLGFSS